MSKRRKRKMTQRQIAVLGGKAGKGKAKARPTKVARAAAKARWDAWRKAKAHAAKAPQVITMVSEAGDITGSRFL